MSLESYLKTLEEQRRRESEIRGVDVNPIQRKKANKRSNYSVNTYANKRTRHGKKLLYFLITAVLLIAIIENPSNTRAKADVNTIIKERVKEIIWKSNSNKTEWDEIGAGLAMLFAPTVIDNYLQTKTSNYVLFSTFETNCFGISGPVFSGIIIFGKVIPLTSRLK